MMKEVVPVVNDRKPLFPGDFCFPLSPENNIRNPSSFASRRNTDQLEMIFTILGTPSETDILAFERDDARRYIRLFSKQKGVEFASRFAGASIEAIDLLQRMLAFNATRRISVQQCLEHRLFADIRNMNLERDAQSPQRITLPFDDSTPMDEEQLRFAFISEIQKFHPEVQMPTRFGNIPGHNLPGHHAAVQCVTKAT